MRLLCCASTWAGHWRGTTAGDRRPVCRFHALFALNYRQIIQALPANTMNLHQLRVDFDAEHDRLLLRIATNDEKELLLWLTRRCVRLLWPLLVELIKSDPRIVLQSDPEARAALLGFEHEKALSQTNFSRPYEEAARERPLGSEPILVSRVSTSTDESGSHVLSFAQSSGHQVNLTLDPTLLHSLCGLLRKVVVSADWDLELALPRGAIPDAERVARTIN